MLLADLVKTSTAVAATRKRLEKIDLLTNFLRRLDPREIEIGVGYLSGVLRQGRIGIGWVVLREARAEPRAAEAALALLDVDSAFERIARIQGRGSVAARRRELGQLFTRATAEEQEFLFRLILGELRQGALEGVMIEAITKAASLTAANVRRAVMLAGDPAVVAKAALTEGEPGLGRFSLDLLKPVKPMLAQPAEDVADVLDAFGEAALEYKLDGARIQAHKSGDEVRVFTRRLHEVSASVPEVVEAVRNLPVRQLILDGEIIALQDDGRPYPFQITMRRVGRKLDVEQMRNTLPLTAFYFDCLHFEGEDLIDQPARERFACLAAALPEEQRVPATVTARVDAADRFLRAALERGHEGIMAKALESAYEAGSRGSSWLKVKPAHTLDLVVLAAEWGSGRRQGWLSNLHLGARDPIEGGFIMLGKTFKGLTDAMLKWQTKRLLELEIGREEHVVHVRPELVVEIAFNEIQASPHYPGGLALRFARVKRYRKDKKAAEADTIDAIREIYEGRRLAGT